MMMMFASVLGGKKFKIEIDSSIWREEIPKKKIRLVIWREDIGNRNRLLDLAGRHRQE
jgi:hypothetical protein